MSKYLFVGERPSKRALELNVGWKDGALAGKQLFDALLANGINPKHQLFINIFHIDRDEVNPVAYNRILKSHRPIVVMGEKVKSVLSGKYHFDIIHPAARGKIRNKQLYATHVGESLFLGKIYKSLIK